MPLITLIGRLSDGLPLAASMADERDAFGGELETYERQAKKILRSVSKQHAEAGSYQPAASPPEPYVTVESGDHFSFHYIIDVGVCILTLTEKAYPRRLAYDYLDELRTEFQVVHGKQVEVASRPYEFIRFDTFIQKTKKLYSDSRTQRNLDKLNSDLREVHSIMTKNINDVLGRGQTLDSALQKSSRLASESKKYRTQAIRANRIRVIRQYAPVAVIALVLLVCLWWFYLR